MNFKIRQGEKEEEKRSRKIGRQKAENMKSGRKNENQEDCNQEKELKPVI